MGLISSSCWYARGAVEGNSTEFLIDTGSTYTILDIRFFRDIESKIDNPLTSANVSLRGASGNLLKVFGQVVVTLNIGGRSFEMEVKVVDIGDKSTILGLDFMSNFDCVLNMKQGFMRIEGQKVKLARKNETKCVYIKATNEFCIPPNHEMIVQGKFDRAHWNPKLGIGLVDPIKSASTRTGILVAKSIVDTQKHIIPVRVANFSEEMLVVHQNSKLALLQPVTSVKNFEIKNEVTL